MRLDLALLVNSITRDQHDDLAAVDDRLAAKPGSRREAGSFVQKIILGLTVFRKMLRPALDDDVTGGAGTVSAAGMLERHAVAKHHVENRTRLAVVLKRGLGRIEFNPSLGRASLIEHTKFCHR
jgi:hypothetical protein